MAATTKVQNLSNDNIHDDLTSVYDLTNGDEEFILPVELAQSARIEVQWGEFDYPALTTLGTALDATDATVDIYESIDSVNSQLNPIENQIVMSSASGSGGFEVSLIKSNYIHIKVTQGSNTQGTVRILGNLKYVS